MRLFAAIALPDPVRADLLAALPAGPRYVPVERWHLTLAFYGSEAALDDLAARLRRAGGRVAPFELLLAGGGAFRGPGGATVWCGLAGEVAALRRLGESAAAAGARAGAGPGPPRPFRPHVSVARLRRPTANNISDDAAPPLVGQAEMLASLAGYRGPRWTVRDFALYRSFLGATPRHEQLATFPLAC